jgi:hypothetical protein
MDNLIWKLARANPDCRYRKLVETPTTCVIEQFTGHALVVLTFTRDDSGQFVEDVPEETETEPDS